MATYNLKVHVSQADLKILKAGKFKLCVAKMCNGKYNTVWQGLDFFEYSTVSWTEQYQVFGSQAFQDGALVQAVTNAVPIKFGQTAVLDSTPIMNPASGPSNASGTFTISNQYGVIAGGVNGMVNGKWAPIYVSGAIPLGTLDLTPVVKVLVFFSAEYQTGSMFAKAVSNTIEVDFTGTTTQNIDYTAGIWAVGGSLVMPLTYLQESNTFALEDTLPSKENLTIAIIALNSALDTKLKMKKYEVRAVASYATNTAATAAIDHIVNNKPSDIVIREDNTDPLKANFQIGYRWWKDAEAALKARMDACQGSDLIDTLQDIFCHVINGAPERYTSLCFNFDALS